MKYKIYAKLLLVLLVSSGACLFVAGCGDKNTEDAADEVGETMQKGAEQVKEAADEAVDAVKDATN